MCANEKRQINWNVIISENIVANKFITRLHHREHFFRLSLFCKNSKVSKARFIPLIFIRIHVRTELKDKTSRHEILSLFQSCFLSVYVRRYWNTLEHYWKVKSFRLLSAWSQRSCDHRAAAVLNVSPHTGESLTVYTTPRCGLVWQEIRRSVKWKQRAGTGGSTVMKHDNQPKARPHFIYVIITYILIELAHLQSF